MALTMWGQLIIQATSPAEDPVKVGTLWVDTSATATLKVCTAVSPYTFAAISGSLSAHDHTSTAGDGGVLTNDEHDGYSDYANSAAPATPAAGHTRIYAATNNGHTQFHQVDEDGMHLRVCRDAALLVRNTSGAPITKGQTVDVYSATGAIPNIRLADSNTVPPRHAEGFALETIADNGFGMILLSGEITGLDTSAFAEGAEIYQSTVAGAFTATPPTDGTLVQSLGVITKSHATQGSIEAIIALPLVHAPTHTAVGVDPIKLDDFAAPDNNTDLNVTSTAHGLAPVSPADATKFLNGAATPAYALVKDSDLSTSDVTTNDVSTTKHGFAPKAPNDATKFLNGVGAYAVPASSAKPVLTFLPTSNQPPATGYATLDTRNSIAVLDFDAAAIEAAIFVGVLGSTYAGGGLTVEISWMATSATTGDVKWNAYIERGNTDQDADSFAAAQTTTTTTNATSGIETKTTITFTNGAQMDSLAAGETFRLKIERDATAGGDTMAGDAEVKTVVIRET